MSHELIQKKLDEVGVAKFRKELADIVLTAAELGVSSEDIANVLAEAASSEAQYLQQDKEG